LAWAFRQASLEHVEVAVTVAAFLAFEHSPLDPARPHPIHHPCHFSDHVVPVVAFRSAQKHRDDATVGIKYQLRVPTHVVRRKAGEVDEAKNVPAIPLH
jgi:hypothetical protein